jgi:hypothetical protein
LLPSLLKNVIHNTQLRNQWQIYTEHFEIQLPFVKYSLVCFMLGFMVLYPTFNTIPVISWRLVLLVEETGVPGENTYLSLTNFIT